MKKNFTKKEQLQENRYNANWRKIAFEMAKESSDNWDQLPPHEKLNRILHEKERAKIALKYMLELSIWIYYNIEQPKGFLSLQDIISRKGLDKP